ncbi:MAG: acyl-CoA dehydrogenase family protein [Alphaproteobacteria bacterium]|nr:acyl-CoA dehydrogenase family protein [Alphaproteobacteria bacterium]
MDARTQIEDGVFLAEVRDFLARELTPELQEAGRQTTHTYSEFHAARAWQRKLHRRGWVAPVWPVAHGGAGWTARQRLLFEHECARWDAPILFAGGIRTIGPLLIAAGSPAQRERYLPRILAGDDYWCQGFSETQAGSDLAALQLAARRDGDAYVLNGSKIWTTGAHDANRMFALVRTAQKPKRQDGITFLLIDMDTPGITVKPIISLAGDHEVNQVFFDDARIPVTQRVGDEDEGWATAKLLMRFARSSNTTSGLVRRALNNAQRAIAKFAPGDEDIRMRKAQLECEITGLEALEIRLLTGGGEVTEVTSSLLKTLATELHQRVSELGLETVGLAGQPMTHGSGTGELAMRKYLNTRAATIYSGTNETHRNLMGGALLGRL